MKLRFILIFFVTVLLSEVGFAGMCGDYAHETGEEGSNGYFVCECDFPKTVDKEKEKRDFRGNENVSQVMNALCPQEAPKEKCSDSNSKIDETGKWCVCNHAQFVDTEADAYRPAETYSCPTQNPSRSFCPEGTTNVKEEGRSFCQCNIANTSDGTRTKISVFDFPDPFDPVRATEIAKARCPVGAASASLASNETFLCIADLEEKIRTCGAEAKTTSNACSKVSEENDGIQKAVTGTSSQVAAALQNSGSVESCQKAGFLSSAGAYGAGMMRKNCNEQIVKCEDTCKDKYGKSLFDYQDTNDILSYCERQTKGTEVLSPAPANAQNLKNFKDHANELVTSVSKSYDICRSENKETSAKNFLRSTLDTAGNFVASNKQAVNCVNTLSKTSVVPLSIDCVLAGGGPGCPTNCISPNNANDPSCKVINGTVSQLSAIASKTTPYAGLSLGSGKGTSDSTGLGNLDLGDDSGTVVPTTKPVTNEDGSPMFSSAQHAQAGSAGATRAAEADKNGNTSSENYEDKSFFGGAFTKMKTAANTFLSSSGSFFGSKNKETSIQSSTVNSKMKNSSLRGLAGFAGGSKCYIDSKGAEFCFGRPNMDIFKMMSKQYVQQDRNNKFFGN